MPKSPADGSAGGSEAVDFGEDVSEDVGDGEQNYRSVTAKGPRDQLPRVKGPMRQTFCAIRFETSRMTTNAVVSASRYLKLRVVVDIVKIVHYQYAVRSEPFDMG